MSIEVPLFSVKKKEALKALQQQKHEKLLKNTQDLEKELAKKYLHLANSYYEKSNFNAAMECFTKLIAISQGTTYPFHAYLQKSFCLFLQGDYSAAIIDLTLCVQCKSPILQYEGLRLRGLIHASLEQAEHSKKDFFSARLLTISNHVREIFSEDCLLVESFHPFMASHYFKLAKTQSQKNIIEIYYSEAIRLQPNAPNYYAARAKFYRELAISEKAQADENQLFQLQRKKSRLPLPSSYTQQAKLPTSLVKYITEFGDDASINSLRKASKAYWFILAEKLKEGRLFFFNQVEKEWEQLIAVKGLTEFCLKPTLGQPLLNNIFVENIPAYSICNAELRVKLLQKAIEMECFTFIRYLREYGVDINKPWLEDSYPEMKGSSLGLDSLSGVEHTALDLVVKQQPFPARKIMTLMQLKFDMKQFFYSDICPRAFELLTSKRTSLKDLEEAEDLVMYILRNKILQIAQIDLNKADYRGLLYLMNSQRYCEHPLVREIEIHCLIQKLSKPIFIIPTKRDFVTKKTNDLQKILAAGEITQAHIADLKKIKCELMAPNIGEYQNELLDDLRLLNKDFPNIFGKEINEVKDQKLKLLSAKTGDLAITPPRSTSSPSSSNSPSHSGSPGSTSPSLSDVMRQTVWHSPKSPVSPDVKQDASPSDSSGPQMGGAKNGKDG